jgi:3-methylcrotonyl-CoA carboxylase beta subunit
VSSVEKPHAIYRSTSPDNSTRFYSDPQQHATLKAEIESQSSALYATARLWDDGIIKPTDTRDVVGLGLALAVRERGLARSTTWDGNGAGYGVFRM